MCTVTFIPEAGDIYLTSNRDERPGRAPALFPSRSGSNGGQLLFPKDGEAGGSWIALKRSGDAAVLLSAEDYRRLSDGSGKRPPAWLDPRFRVLSDDEHDELFSRDPDPGRVIRF